MKKRGRRALPQEQKNQYGGGPSYRQQLKLLKQIQNVQPRQQKPSCNCKGDYYDSFHKKKLKQIFNNVVSKRKNTNTDNYTFKLCSNGEYHLWKNEKRILMVNQRNKLLRDLHEGVEESDHLSPDAMKMFIKIDQEIDYDSIQPYIDTYLNECDECSQNSKVCPNPYFKNLIKKPQTPKQQRLKGFLEGMCENDACRNDSYDQIYEMCRYVFVNCMFPPKKKKDDFYIHKNKIEKVIEEIKNLEVRKCKNNNFHLWVQNKSIRYLMRNEKLRLYKQAHGQYHNSEEIMFDMIIKSHSIFSEGLWQDIKSYVFECPKCRVKSLKSLSISHETISYMQKKEKQKVLNLKSMVKKQEQQRFYVNEPKLDVKKQFQQLTNLSTEQYKEIKYFIQKLPLQETQQQHMQKISSKFRTQDYQIKKVYDSVIWTNSAQEESLKYIQKRGVVVKQIKSKQKDIQLQRGFFITTPSMKDNYLKYGDVVCLDYLSQPLQKRTPNGLYYKVCFLTGQDQNTNIVLFGCFLICHSSIQYYKQMFMLIFSEMDNVIPGAFVSNENIVSQCALNQLKKQHKFSYRFLLSWYSKIEQLKIEMRQQPQKNRLLELFRICILQQQNNDKFFQICKEINQLIINQNTFWKFLQESSKYCLSNVPKKFIGYTLSTSRNQELYKIIRLMVTFQSKLSVFIKYILIMNKQLQSMSRSDFITRQLEQNKEKSRSYKVCEINKLQYNIIDEESDSSSKLTYNLQNNCWRCSCKQLYWTGLPCSHLIFIVGYFDGNIQYYINTRWLMRYQMKGQTNHIYSEDKEEAEKYSTNIYEKSLQQMQFINKIYH